MRTVRWCSGVAAALLLAAAVPGGRAQPRPAARTSAALSAPLEALRRGWLAGSPDEVERAGRRAGAGGLSLAIASSDRLLAQAAADAAPAAEDAPWLLVPLASAARSADRPLAVRASRAAARIASAADRERLLLLDVPLDWVRSRIAEYRAIAADADRWADVRVGALEVASRLHRALGSDAAPADAPYDLAAALADPDPELRRAAVELAPAPLEQAQLELLAGRVAGDEDPVVAVAAGQVACEGIAFGESARPVLAALGAAGIARLQDLVPDPALPLAARLGAARCLAAEGSKESRAAVKKLPRQRRGR